MYFNIIYILILSYIILIAEVFTDCNRQKKYAFNNYEKYKKQ